MISMQARNKQLLGSWRQTEGSSRLWSSWRWPNVHGVGIWSYTGTGVEDWGLGHSGWGEHRCIGTDLEKEVQSGEGLETFAALLGNQLAEVRRQRM